jgi:hypothetical protein
MSLAKQRRSALPTGIPALFGRLLRKKHAWQTAPEKARGNPVNAR